MVDQIVLSRAASVEPWLDRDAYPFTDRWLRISDGVLHYLDEGTGPVLLFVHGTPTWSFEWRHLVSALSPRFRCIALDHLGFGLSERPGGADYAPDAHARRFAEFADALDLRDVTVVVHDFGGPIALPWVLEHQDRVGGLTIVNSWMWSFDDDPVVARRAKMAGSWLGKLLYRWLNASLRMLMPSVYGDRRKLTPEIHAQYLAPFRDRDARVDVLFALRVRSTDRARTSPRSGSAARSSRRSRRWWCGARRTARSGRRRSTAGARRSLTRASRRSSTRATGRTKKTRSA